MRVLGLILVVAACGGGSPEVPDAPITEPPDAPESPAPSAPNLSVTDGSGTPIVHVKLGETDVGQAASSAIQIHNTGSRQLGPIELTLTGLAVGEFATTGCADVVLAPLERCTAQITFRPITRGARTATLVIGTPTGSTTLALGGSGLAPELHFIASSLDLGPVEIAVATEATLELRNDGDASAPIDAITVAGAGYALGADTCGFALAPGASCSITMTAAPVALGANDGSVVVSSAGQSLAAELTARGARRVTIVATGGGSVSSDPAGIDCGTSCSALFEGDVTLTATPGAGAPYVVWALPECGANASCTIPADIVPVTATATFSSGGSVDITFAGNADGEVVVLLGGGQHVSCTQTCSVPASPGQNVDLGASSPHSFDGFSGACTGAPPGCRVTLPSVGSVAVTAMFTKDPKEQWTRPVTGLARTAAFDSTDALVVGTTTHVVKLSPLGATVWSVAMPAVSLATGPDDSIYVQTGAAVAKLAANGTLLWTQPLDANTIGCPRSSVPHFTHCLAVGPDGEVVVRGARAVTRWDSSGVQTWSVTDPPGMLAVLAYGAAIDLAGRVMIDRNEYDDIVVVRFAADGTLQPGVVGYGERRGMITNDYAGNLLMTTTEDGIVYLSALTPIPVERTVQLGSTYSEFNSGVAGTGTGDLAWLYHLRQYETYGTDWKLVRLAPSGVETWSVTRRFADFGSIALTTGTQPYNVAGSPTGRIAVVGHYVGASWSGGGWVQVYVP